MRNSTSGGCARRSLRQLFTGPLERWAVLILFLGAMGQLRSGFDAPLAFDAGYGPRGDGILDLVVANPGSNTVSVLLGNGDGTFQASRSFAAGLGPNSVAVGDFNGDGHIDLAVANFDQFNSVFAVSILLGNGDGWPDLALAGYGSNDVVILINDGNWPP
ncbi:MAG TPA: VCBS repeat-containing protein [Gemmataceae bacterium]|nr:VCBS repeat-containing protein [Gemmataceae bacterium]